MDGGDGLVSRVRCWMTRGFEQADAYLLAPMLPVIVVILTHFTAGFERLVGDVAFADVMCFSGVVVAVGVLLFKKRLGDSDVVRRFLWAVSMLAACSLLVAYAAHDVIGSVGFFVFALMEGAFVAATSIFWFDYFADQSIESALVTLSICIIGGCAIAWFLLGLSGIRFVLAQVVLFVAEGLLLPKALLRQKDQAGLSARSCMGTRSPAVLLVTSFALCFACMLSLSLAGRHLWHSNELWLFIAPAAFAVLMVVLLFRQAEIGVLLLVALILSVASVLLTAFLDINSETSLVVATNGVVITISLSIVFTLSLAKGANETPHTRGALQLIAVFAGLFAGRGAAEAIFLASSETVKAVVAAATIVVLIVAVFACLNNTTMLSTVRRKLMRAKKVDEGAASRLACIESFAERQGLGSREREVLLLLLEGCTAREVAERMFIADGTAKAHIRHVYQKLDVHDREGLFEVVRLGAVAGSSTDGVDGD